MVRWRAASERISMNCVEIMIGEKLKESDPALDILGSDRKVLQVACEDFTNYLKFHWQLIRKHQTIEQSLENPQQRRAIMEEARVQAGNPRNNRLHPNQERRNLRNRNPLREPPQDGAGRKTRTTPQ